LFIHRLNYYFINVQRSIKNVFNVFFILPTEKQTKDRRTADRQTDIQKA